MKKIFITMMVAVSALSMALSDAQAKRLGGGGSIGKQSQSVSRQAPAPAQSSQATNTAKPAPAPAATPSPAAPAPTPSLPPKPASPWKGIVGGALLGLGLGAMMSHFGMGGAIGSILGSLLMIGLLALAAMFIYRMFSKKTAANNPQASFAGTFLSSGTPDTGARIDPVSTPRVSLQKTAPQAEVSGSTVSTIPADFDAPAFLRNAKTYFIRLQAAWDKADIDDLREFTTPEMYAELKLQIQERGGSANNTDVVSLDAELLGVETLGDDYLVSVKFSGMIKEAPNEPAAQFVEVWNLSKPLNGNGGWVLAGIQQLS